MESQLEVLLTEVYAELLAEANNDERILWVLELLEKLDRLFGVTS